MPILFSAVACNKRLLTKFASCDGNFMEIVEEVISKIPCRNDKMTYSHGHYLLHYIVQEKYFYFCITDKSCQRSRAFLFLNEIQRKFQTSKKSDEFANVLSAEMYRFSEDHNTITIRKGDLDELNSIGVGSSETILGEKILFVNNIDNLPYYSTISYVRKTPERVLLLVKNTNTKLYLTVAVIIILILGLAIYIFGPTSSAILIGGLLFFFFRSIT
ncbi:vesicle-associated membrane protein 7-like [Galleria mellonella]|uniref:Vesicle-associated membrane protein 7-like n=1 Tax=Galleria mellonella TaxID=7137 RepID=A0A6J1X642_GALME|nr:vesicle-associated membrane protein 7-like [Galleria mellonella]